MGYLGLKADPSTTSGAAVREVVSNACLFFHVLASAAMWIAAAEDGKHQRERVTAADTETDKARSPAITVVKAMLNPHNFLALGFAAVCWGWSSPTSREGENS